MANTEHLDLLKQGVEVWNQWRKKFMRIKPPDLSGADLSFQYLEEADFRWTNLQGANLSRSTLTRAKLYSCDLTQANLTEAILLGALLSGAKLSQTNFSNANLMLAEALGCDFKDSTLTGACIQHWNINAFTKLDSTICEHIFLKHLGGPSFRGTQTTFEYYPAKFGERRPSSGSFKAGEFAALFQQALDTIDLVFIDGLDWQVFFASMQEIRQRYIDTDINIQAVEKKSGGAFIVRLEVSESLDKVAFSKDWKLIHEENQRLRGQLLKMEGKLEGYKEQRDYLQQKALEGMNTPKNVFNQPQFGGAFIESNYGTVEGGIINNYGPHTEDITRLLAALRDQVQTFPTDQKDEAIDILDDLEGDIAKPEPDQGRIGRRLKKLVAIATLLTGLASGAAAVSGDLNDFTNNVIELTEKLGISIEQVQLPPSSNP